MPRRCREVISSRKHFSRISYFAMWALGIAAIIVRLATEGKTQQIAELIILAKWTLFLILFAVLNIIIVDSFDTLYVAAYIGIVCGTTLICRWYFAVPDNEVVIYLPLMVNLGILVTATATDILQKPPGEQEALWNRFQACINAIAKFSLGGIFRGAAAAAAGYPLNRVIAQDIADVGNRHERDITLNETHELGA